MNFIIVVAITVGEAAIVASVFDISDRKKTIVDKRNKVFRDQTFNSDHGTSYHSTSSWE